MKDLIEKIVYMTKVCHYEKHHCCW